MIAGIDMLMTFVVVIDVVVVIVVVVLTAGVCSLIEYWDKHGEA